MTETVDRALMIPNELLIFSAVIAVLILLAAIRQVNWSAIQAHRAAQHMFWGSVLVVSVFWYLRAGIQPGIEFHILGYTALTLMMGWQLALLAAFFVQLLMLLAGKFIWQELAYQYVFFSALPVMFSYGFYLLVYRRMTHNPFVYILVAGFFNAGFTHAFTDIVRSALLLAMELYTPDILWRDYLRYLPLMMFPEGVVNGMFITGMVVFHPRWLSTFDEDSYFR